MIAITLALAALQSSVAINDNDVRFMREAQDLNARLDSCIEASVSKFIDSREPADVVAAVAMWECQGRVTDVFENTVRYMQAALPTRDAQAVRREQAAKHPAFIQARTEQAVYYVVTRRLGMSSDMPVEEYNSIKR